MKQSNSITVQRVLASRFTTIGLAMSLLFIGWLITSEIVARNTVVAKMERVQSRYDEALKKQEELERVLALMDSPEYLEFEAKEKLNLKKTGEQVFVIGSEPARNTSEQNTQSSQFRAKGWLDFLGF